MSAFDVLAVLSALEVQTRQRGGSPSCVTIAAAHAAVAELIEAADAMQAYIGSGMPISECFERRSRLRAALARVRGGAA